MMRRLSDPLPLVNLIIGRFTDAPVRIACAVTCMEAVLVDDPLSAGHNGILCRTAGCVVLDMANLSMQYRGKLPIFMS